MIWDSQEKFDEFARKCQNAQHTGAAYRASAEAKPRSAATYARLMAESQAGADIYASLSVFQFDSPEHLVNHLKKIGPVRFHEEVNMERYEQEFETLRQRLIDEYSSDVAVGKE